MIHLYIQIFNDSNDPGIQIIILHTLSFFNKHTHTHTHAHTYLFKATGLKSVCMYEMLCYMLLIWTYKE